jgi:hypothetical protein
MNSSKLCHKCIKARVIKGTFKGITGLLSNSTLNGLYIVWGDLCNRPLVYGPFSPDEVEILQEQI